MESVPAMTDDIFLDTCNKSVGFYILPDRPQLDCHGTILHNYIYRRWFRPYRSDIECKRFICKFIAPKDLPDNSATLQLNIDSVVRLNDNVCASVAEKRRHYQELLASRSEYDIEGRDTWELERRLRIIKHHEAYVLQPLFRALLVIFSGADWRGENSKAAGQLPVTLVRTDVESGLSEPITFDTIADKVDCCLGDEGSAVRVSLEVAIDFVMTLEAREAAAMGLNPDPVVAWNAEFDPSLFKGVDLEMGPSSRLVDTSRISKWSGDGPDVDALWGGGNRVISVGRI